MEQKNYVKGWIAANGKRAEDRIVLTLPKPKDLDDLTRCLEDFLVSFKRSQRDLLNIILQPKDERLWNECKSDEFIADWAFVRGVFDSCGWIDKNQKACGFYVFNSELVGQIMRFVDIADMFSTETGVYFRNSNALDFLSKLYDFSEVCLARNKRKYYNYFAISQRVANSGPVKCLVSKVDPNAVIPAKKRASDIGYDLTLISVSKKISPDTWLYDTGICVEPDFGWYMEIIPRSSLSSSGYMLTNSLGIIDPPYRGSLKISLTKIDPTKPNLVLPERLGQMVLRQAVHYLVKEVSVDQLTKTERGAKGFGSSGK
jgi:dUTP pyrophosphatase